MISMLTAAAVFTAPVPAMTNDWFSPVYDWPKTGLRPNELLVVEAEITVNPRGYMQSCTGHVYSGIPAMGPYVCSRLRLRNVFEPARDAEKHRIYGVYRNFIILFSGSRNTKEFPKDYRHSDFDIAVPAGSKLSTHYFIIQFAVDAQGRPSHCSLVAQAGFGLGRHRQEIAPAIVERACADVPLNLHVAPTRDGSGNAVPSVQNATVGLIEAK